MLYAHRTYASWTPLLISLGLFFWLGAVTGGTGVMPLKLILLLGGGSLGLFALAPLTMTSGTWLAIDRYRGWIHWRAVRRLHGQRESFSPQRIESLQIVRRGWRLGPKAWAIVLKLDHPRVSTVGLGWTLNRRKAQTVARQWAAMLEVNWIDERGLLHVAIPDPEGPGPVRCGQEWLRQLPPPPEIGVESVGKTIRVLLPNTMEGVLCAAAYLFYSVLWCLWAWSSLIIEWRGSGSIETWTRAEDWTVMMLGAGSVGGLALLFHALVRVAGRQELELSASGLRLGRRWLGMRWGVRPLAWNKAGWMRRVDAPGVESGLWLPAHHREVRLAPGLSADALTWLQQMLTRAA
jgi:hypothetical protein